MTLRCAANVVCGECGVPLSLTFSWFADAAPTSTERIGVRLFMCPECRSPFAWPLPQGAVPGRAVRRDSEGAHDAVVVPFLSAPKVTEIPAAQRGTPVQLSGAALPAMERLQHLVWTTWPALYTLIYVRQC